MTEKTILPFFNNQDWKKFKKQKKINKLLSNITIDNITESNKLNYAEANLVCDKNR